MPPKKKAKTAPKASSEDTAAAPPTPQAPTTTTLAVLPPSPVFSDGWTDEQETTLFKAISVYRLKPAGIHKHFRIIGIAELMKNHGVSGAHTGITGIWAKLKTLYNLEGLDEREDAPEEDADPEEDWHPFELPEDVYGEMMMARRIDPDSRDSPLRVAGSGKSGLVLDEEDDTLDEKSSRASSPVVTSTRGGRGGRGRGRGRGRPGRGRGRGRGGAAAVAASDRSEKKSSEEKSVAAASDRSEQKNYRR
ncbi:CT20-domain-containing protein [Wilcoxina mikolae CBS 423.85]|nr:CT20-domain-containing protein [Wilcoxina mikolae CBS 423.85]